MDEECGEVGATAPGGATVLGDAGLVYEADEEGGAGLTGAGAGRELRRMPLRGVPYDLDLIGSSGQVFRWVCQDGGPQGRRWLVPARGEVCSVRMGHDCVEVRAPARSIPWWLSYLRLTDQDLEFHRGALRELAALPDPMPRIVARYGGVRVLRQEPWEAAVSFVISQNNNVARIRAIVGRICAGPLEPLPSPAGLASILEERGDRLGLGYRLPYLEVLCQEWGRVGGLLAQRRGYQADLELLTSLRGIGPKVARCICLYGLGHLQAVPVDTWIRRAQDGNDIAWHPRLGGLQQQMVFEWMRANGRRAAKDLT